MEGRRQIWAVVNRVRSRFWIMTGLGTFSLSLLILTILLNDWIEIAFRIDPDGGSGSLEWMIVVALFVVATLFFLVARIEWRRAATGRI